MNNSRLNRNLEKQSKQQIIISVIGIIIVLVLLFKFAIPVVSAVSGFFIGLNEKTESQRAALDNTVKLQVPKLDFLLSATNSAQIIVSGSSFDKDGKIQIFLNDSLAKETDIKDDKTFSDTIDGLSSGDNSIKARLMKDDKTSDFSEERIVKFTKEEPKIEVSFPSDNQEFKHGDDQLTIKGKTDPVDNKVTVNGYRAIVDENGNFSYFMKLPEGETALTIEAQNQAGVKSKKELKVRYSP